MTLLNPPPPILHITRVLEDAGFEAWCVGGAVRDALLGIENQDWDLTTSALPQQVRALFKRTVPVGIEFGTVGVLDENKVMHEVTTFRHDIETDGRHAVVKFGASLEEDLARRDFTINALAYSPQRDEIRDPFGGQKDLDARILRAVGTPALRMEEDRLRALRGIRFASRFHLKINPETWQAIRASAPYLKNLSAERIKQEIEKTMEQVQCPSRAFRLWKDSGALEQLVPKIANISSVSLKTIDMLPTAVGRKAGQRRILRIAALFSSLNAKNALAVLKDLRFSNQDSQFIADIIANFHALGDEMREALAGSEPAGASARPTDVQIRRWAGSAGRGKIGPVIRLLAARWSAERFAERSADGSAENAHDNNASPSIPPAAVRDFYRRSITAAFRDPLSVADLAVNGTDLQAIGIQGKKLGQVLRILLDAVIIDPSLNNRNELLSRARGAV